MKDFDLTTLRLFVAVCEAQSIKRVSEREKVDASAITKRLSKLEAQLEMPLLKRVRQGVQATPEGLILCEQAKKLVRDAQIIALNLTHSKSALTGTITLAASSANVASLLTDDLASFLQLPDQRKIQIIVKEMISKDVVQAVRDGSASIGVIWDNTETSGLQHAEYYHDQIAVVTHQDHPLCKMKAPKCADALKFDMVTMKNSRHTEALLRRTGALEDEHMRSRLEVSTWEAGLRAASHGVGAFLCSARLAQMYAETWKLRVMPLADVWSKQINKVIYPSGLVHPLAMQLVTHLSHRHRQLEAAPDKTQATLQACAL
jgi:DNA-binding transcriptional LysR family regulator